MSASQARPRHARHRRSAQAPGCSPAARHTESPRRARRSQRRGAAGGDRLGGVGGADCPGQGVMNGHKFRRMSELAAHPGGHLRPVRVPARGVQHRRAHIGCQRHGSRATIADPPGHVPGSAPATARSRFDHLSGRQLAGELLEAARRCSGSGGRSPRCARRRIRTGTGAATKPGTAQPGPRAGRAVVLVMTLGGWNDPSLARAPSWSGPGLALRSPAGALCSVISETSSSDDISDTDDREGRGAGHGSRG
jgi:hypothetical protein